MFAGLSILSMYFVSLAATYLVGAPSTCAIAAAAVI